MWAITSRLRDFFRLSGSVQLKFAVSYIALIMALLLLLNTYPMMASRDLVFGAKQSSLVSQALSISQALGGNETLDGETVGQAIGYMDVGGLSRIMVTDDAGVVLYDSSDGGSNVGRYDLMQELYTALGGNDVFYAEYAGGVFLSRAACPIMSGDTVIGGVYLYEQDTDQGLLIVGMQRNLQNISIVVFVASLFLALFFSRTLTARLTEMLSAIRIVGKGDYSYKVGIRGDDEVAELGQAFNSLTDRLQETEEMRRRFVSDASHELKTPLASIRLLSDSIVQSEDMDEGTIREFVEDIGQEAERLARTTEKLLNLTRLDVAPVTDISTVEVAGVVERAAHLLRPLADGKDVHMEFDLEPGCVIMATEDDLYQIVFNLAENGIKYNVEGGTLGISLHRREEQVVLTVEDTGIGIPEEDIPHIFDRFYRVDKARSRELGGSGLGLSIVRDTVLQHGGHVEVAGREGGGTRFTVTFPLWREEAEPCGE